MAKPRAPLVGDGGDATTVAAHLAQAVAELQRLDASALQRRWRALVGGALPKELGRPLTLRILAYKLQAERLGDLDKASQHELAAALESGVKHKKPDCKDPVDGSDASRAAGGNVGAEPSGHPRFARPGTVLAREHGGVLHRVMVLSDGVAWNGRTYDSLSQVAFAITGTKWNGPRFFGLRNKPIKQASAGLQRRPPAGERRAEAGGQARSAEKLCS